jgi:hypothetical protein
VLRGGVRVPSFRLPRAADSSVSPGRNAVFLLVSFVAVSAGTFVSGGSMMLWCGARGLVASRSGGALVLLRRNLCVLLCRWADPALASSDFRVAVYVPLLLLFTLFVQPHFFHLQPAVYS